MAVTPYDASLHGTSSRLAPRTGNYYVVHRSGTGTPRRAAATQSGFALRGLVTPTARGPGAAAGKSGAAGQLDGSQVRVIELIRFLE